MSADPITEVAEAVAAGLLVVVPTDTVHGIAARPDDAAATGRLFEAKRRPRDLELPVLVSDEASARAIARFDDRADVLGAAFWPGPLTLVLPRTTASLGWELGGDPSTIGVRVPKHPLALAVLARTGPLAVTSANRSGRATPVSCDQIADVFGDLVAVYVCSESALSGAASTVLDLAHGEPRVIRQGALTASDVREVLSSRGVPAGGPPEGAV